MTLDFFSKLKRNPSLVFLYLIMLIPILIMCYFLVLDYTRLQQDELGKNELVAKVLAENLDSFLGNVKGTLEGVSKLPPIKNREQNKIETIFQNLMLANNQVSLFWESDLQGNIIAQYPKRADKSNNNLSKSNNSPIKELLKQSTMISDPQIDPTTGLEVITIYTLIKDSKGIAKGAVGASIPLEELHQKLLLKIGKTGYPMLVSKKRQFLVHSPRKEVSQKTKINPRVYQAFMKGGAGTVSIVAPFDHEIKFFSYAPLKQANWVVLVVQPISELHANIASFLSRNVVIIMFALLVIVLAAYYLVLFRKREEESTMLQAEKLSIVGELAAGMAHEIRNPLTSIKGFIQLATSAKRALPPEHLDIIIDEVDRIEGIIKETMLLAKPAPTQFKTVSLQQLWEETQIIMQPQANLRGVELQMTIEKDLPTLLAEPNHLKQVFINLIRNSVEAAPDSGGQISVSVKKVQRNIVVSFQDNGRGIPQTVLKNLGRPFISTKDTGTGLGLTVSYRIIQNHGGKIDVSSKQGQGTTFTIELPINGREQG